MNAQEFIAHWRNEMDCECMVSGLSHIYKKAKEAAKNLRRAGNCTVAERTALLAQLESHHLRCKAALKRAA